MSEMVFAPGSKPQEYLLNSTSTITLYSGSAGAGKTYALLLTALKFMQYPKSTGVIFRRTSKMITSPGSIWHEAVQMFTSIYPSIRVRNRETELIFPNGSVLKFSHMQHLSNVYDHKGAQYSFVAYDEATDFDELMITFMLSRMRNAHVPYEPQMFLCTNPNYHSFLRHWIQDFYLDHEGIPREDRTNVERYFVLVNNSPLWFDTLEEAQAIYGTGPESGIRSFRSIRARLVDNIPLMKANPSYISNLMSLPRVERLIMLEGSWLARLESSGYWNRSSVKVIPYAPTDSKRRVLAVDFAFTEPNESNKNPDSTAFVVMSKSTSSVYTVEHVETMQKRVHEVEKRLFELAEAFGQETWISLPVDPNAQAGAYARELQRKLGERGFTVRLQKPVKSKTMRFQPFASVSQSGFVQVVDGMWNKAYFDELELFDGTRKVHDDMVDATSDAFYLLNQDLVLPIMETTLLQRQEVTPYSNIPTSQGIPQEALALPINF